eukprot:Nk52_evm1s829 gene=Nk52_evmTU1s829
MTYLIQNVVDGKTPVTERTAPYILSIGTDKNRASTQCSPIIAKVPGCEILIGVPTMKKLGITLILQGDIILWNTFTPKDVIRVLENQFESQRAFGVKPREEHTEDHIKRLAQWDLLVIDDYFDIELMNTNDQAVITVLDIPYGINDQIPWDKVDHEQLIRKISRKLSETYKDKKGYSIIFGEYSDVQALQKQWGGKLCFMQKRNLCGTTQPGEQTSMKNAIEMFIIIPHK